MRAPLRPGTGCLSSTAAADCDEASSGHDDGDPAVQGDGASSADHGAWVEDGAAAEEAERVGMWSGWAGEAAEVGVWLKNRNREASNKR